MNEAEGGVAEAVGLEPHSATGDTQAFDGGHGQANGGLDGEPHPWRRYIARMLDVALLGTIAVMALFILLATLDEAAASWLAASPVSTFLLVPILSWLASMVIIAFCHARWRTTPGKLLCGLRVVDSGGGRLGFAKAIAREGRLALWGVGFGVPLISLLCLANSYSQLESDGETRWDRDSGSVSLARPAGARQIAGTLVAAAVLVAFRVFDAVSLLGG